MKKVFKFIGITLLVLILLAVLILGYLGFVPGVSTVFGSNKPRDLGVHPTAADLTQAQAKLMQRVVDPSADPFTQYKNAPGHAVDVVLSQEEYTAHAEQIHPVSDLQIKLSGSSFEISGRIDKARIPQFVRTWGLTDASDGEVLNAINTYLPVDAIFYVAGSGGAENNRLNVDISRAEFGRLPVSSEQARAALESYTEALFQQVPGFSVESSTIEDGQLHFKGSAVESLPKY